VGVSGAALAGLDASEGGMGGADGAIPAAVEEDRRHLVEATIVRIMKSRRTLPHNDLIAEVTKQLANRFSAQPAFIKRRVRGVCYIGGGVVWVVGWVGECVCVWGGKGGGVIAYWHGRYTSTNAHRWNFVSRRSRTGLTRIHPHIHSTFPSTRPVKLSGRKFDRAGIFGTPAGGPASVLVFGLDPSTWLS
jgi:hypothetical protein